MMAWVLESRGGSTRPAAGWAAALGALAGMPVAGAGCVGGAAGPRHGMRRVGSVRTRRMMSSQGRGGSGGGALPDAVAAPAATLALVDKYARMTPRRITLAHLMQVARRPDAAALVASAAMLQQELPVRLAERVAAMQRLPFIVGCNPHVQKVYSLYLSSLEQIVALPPVQTADDEARFSQLLARLVDEHADVIPELSRGMAESAKYIAPEASKQFLDRKIRARIGIRVLAEHHLAMHDDVQQAPRPNYVGIINTKLAPAAMVAHVRERAEMLSEANYGQFPDLVVNGHTDATLAYLPVHLDYMLFELFKNAYRATVEYARQHRTEPRPIEVTICRGVADLTLRIRDRGGGVPYDAVEDIWKYSYTTVRDEDEDNSVLAVHSRLGMQQGIGGRMAGLGYGLPLTRLYAEYFGGSLQFVSLYGHGADVFLRLNDLGDRTHDIEIL